MSCASKEVEIEKPNEVIIRTVPTKPVKPIIPNIQPLSLREVEWVVITPENQEEVFSRLSDDKVYFAVSADNYEQLALNLSDLRAFIEKQNGVIRIYERQF